MPDTMWRVINYVADNFFYASGLGVLAGAFHGLGLSLANKSAYFNYDPIVDGAMFGGFIAICVWAIAKFASSLIPAQSAETSDTISWKETVFPSFLLIEDSNDKQELARVMMRRFSCLIGLVVFSTLIGTVGAPNPTYVLMGGAAIAVMLFVPFAAVMAKIRLAQVNDETTLSPGTEIDPDSRDPNES